ncbi:hypothetical protein RJ641_000290 [Dillenia turbinata]|uniref:BHLH domain-containing protein n=1 Tax=Dillenia turbinata TaxID=194707 RepID=A0AAN8ZRC7_9MAGN
MADEFQTGICSVNWWDTSRNRYNSGSSPPTSSSSSAVLNNNVQNFGWQQGDRSTTVDSSSVSTTSMVNSQDNSASNTGASSVITDHNLQIMGLGLSRQGIDWNQTLIRGGKSESSYRSMLQEDLSSSSANFQQESGMVAPHDHHHPQVQWRHTSSRGFSLDEQQQHQYNSQSNTLNNIQGNIATSFQMDSTGVYGGNPSSVLQGLLGSEHQTQQQQQSPFENRTPLNNYQYQGSYGMSSNSEVLIPSWSKFPQFLKTSPPKQQPSSLNQLHFSNNTPYWNASATTAATNVDIRPGFFPSLQSQFSTPSFDDKSKNILEVRESSTVSKKSSSTEPSTAKRPRNETSSALPAFKVRKEKMGDRITALQQLVSPFGKTDTASVLSEAIEYIKFLHEQVSVLSTPYMKSGASIQHQLNSDKSKDPEGPKQDLRSRGLCLVPLSSTFPVTHETTVDFWTPTFGGTFR